MPAQKKPADWERIELQYRAGILSLREIAEANDNVVSDTAIRKRAKKFGWERDLGPKIMARADAMVRAVAVQPEGSQKEPDANLPANLPDIPVKRAPEKDTIEANALAVAEVRLRHRSDIARARDMVRKLLDELHSITDRPDLIEALEDALSDEDGGEAGAQRRRKLHELLAQVTGLPSRVGSIKGLAEALKNLIGLEREAWGLTSESKGDDVPEVTVKDWTGKR